MSPGIAASSRLPNRSSKSNNNEMPPPPKRVEQVTTSSVVDESCIPSSIGICTPPPAVLLEVGGNRGASVRGSSVVDNISILSNIRGQVDGVQARQVGRGGGIDGRGGRGGFMFAAG